MEPPGADVPAAGSSGESPEPVGAHRLIAAAAAVALVLAGDGHVLVLGGLLAVVAASRVGAVAALVSTTAVLVRWGAPSLSAAAGGQAVLGPALVLGSARAAASAVLAAVAIALLAPRPAILAVAVGVVAGAVVAGPALPHAMGVRVAGVVAGVVVAYAARWVPLRPWVALAAAFVALAAAA